MDAIDFTWIEIAADFQKDMDLLGWNLPAHYFSEGPQSLEHLIRDLLHTHPQQVREICYRLSISEWRLSKTTICIDRINHRSHYGIINISSNYTKIVNINTNHLADSNISPRTKRIILKRA